MVSLWSVATSIAVLTTTQGAVDRAAPANGGLRYNQLTYSVRAIYEGGGLGGATPYCAAADEDLLMIVYSVRNGSANAISAPAVPRLAIISPEGNILKPNARYTQALTAKVVPPLVLRNGFLAPFSEGVVVDVFVTPRAPGASAPKSASIIYGGWKLRTAIPGTQTINLPNPTSADVLECPRPPSLSARRVIQAF